MSKNIAIIFAGGSGARMGSGLPKQFIEVEGKPIIIHTLELFEEHPNIDAIYIACKKEYIIKLQKMVKRFMITKVAEIVEGGKTGQNFAQDHKDRHIHFTGGDACQQEQEAAACSNQQGQLVAVMQAFCTGLDHPCACKAKNAEQNGENYAPCRILRIGDGQRNAAATADQSGDEAEHPGVSGGAEEGMGAGWIHTHGLAAQVGIVVTGGIGYGTLFEKTAEKSNFRFGAFVAHFHPLMQQNTAVVVHLNKDIAHLRPGKDSQRQIQALSG